MTQNRMKKIKCKSQYFMAFASFFIICSASLASHSYSAPNEIDMLALTCAVDDNHSKLSRVSVLDVTDIASKSKFDYGLVTGHGLPLKQPCYVQDFQGRRQDVLEIYYAPDYKSGESSDWAIISFKKLKTPHLKRYALTHIENYSKEVLDGASVKFAVARGLPYNKQSCELNLLPTSLILPEHVLTHNCQAIYGQSGSPITLDIKGDDKLIGFHIGRVWMFKDPITQRPNTRGYLRVIDADLIKDIHAIIRMDYSK